MLYYAHVQHMVLVDDGGHRKNTGSYD